MGQSYRIRTELGINKTINIQLDQEFEFLEILSLKLQQEDVYIKSCAEYGVVVGRVTANNGFGLPNARVSIFIPIDSVDESNPIISSIYPYKSPSDINEDGYRYNLLPYEKSYSVHAATGTLPSRLDNLTGSTAVEIYDKYYKYTVKTNDSGDYMIMGVPQGDHTLVMDVDLSDIGEFSLTPQDLIRMGLATENQVAGNRFRTSNDLNSLPQIVNVTKSVEVSPLWGDPELCDIAINRVDFDLRDSANIDIQPTAVFMGSIYSTDDSLRVRKNCKPRDNMGNLCQLTTGPGQLLAIRQTIFQDEDGNPVLEQYQLEQSGNIIDGSGAWLTELPMNLDYYITNEFGERVLSYDPTIGIPTKGKYRFKVKWQQPVTLTQQTRRPYYLLPNVKEYGWSSSTSDPLFGTTTEKKQLASSYYFGLAWSGYTDGFTGNDYFTKLNEAINCEDTFYQFDFNKVYTPSSLIDEYKKGARGRFIGIKEIDSQDCDSTINKFPVNEGFRNFDLIFFLFSIVFQILSIIGPILLLVYHFVAFLWNNFAVPILIYLIANFTYNAINYGYLTAGAIAGTAVFGATAGMIAGFIAQTLLYGAGATFLILNFKKIVRQKFGRFKLSMMTYPDCQACECTPEVTTQVGNDANASSTITQFSNSAYYYDKVYSWIDEPRFSVLSDDNFSPIAAVVFSQALGTRTSPINNTQTFMSTKSAKYDLTDTYKNLIAYSYRLPLAERINVFNTRKKYFDGINQIDVTFDKSSNIGKTHTDNTLTIVYSEKYEAGQLLTFVNPLNSYDVNYKWTGETKFGGVINGIQGTALIPTGDTITVSYANPSPSIGQYTTNTQTYKLGSGSVANGESQCVDSLIINVISGGTVTYNTCFSEPKTLTYTTTGVRTITDTDCINLDSLGGTANYTINSIGNTCQRYTYPMDIEYFQVLTAMTITDYLKLTNNVGPGLANTNSEAFQSILTGETRVFFQFTNNGNVEPSGGNPNSAVLSYKDYFQDFENQYVTILQRGVDPYSPIYNNEYGVGKIFGYSNNNAITFTASTRINTPIQPVLNGGISVQKFNGGQSAIFTSSHFFQPGVVGSTTPGLQFSGFQTNAVRYYGSFDGNNNPNSSFFNTPNPNGVKLLVSNSNNDVYSNNAFNSYYNQSEDISGNGVYVINGLDISANGTSSYISDIFPLNYSYTPSSPSKTGMTISSSTLNIMRTDRLPSSDFFQEGAASYPLLQQNLGFQTYLLSDDGTNVSIKGASTGASIPTPDIEGLPNAETVLESFSCEKMVGLDCYTGFGDTFGIKPNCSDSDNIEYGCYVFMNKPLIDLTKDLSNFLEWTYRFRFFYALCRGVLSQTFTNNWVNGSLYMFPIQVDTFYDRQNKVKDPVFCNHLAYFDTKTNNFYYRSSPYRLSTNRFVGRETNEPTAVNGVNLMFPTTITNLGYKDSFYSELSFDPSTRAYIIPDIDSTSYGDTSDLVNLFVISRITDESFLAQILSVGDNSVNQLFSRPGKNSDFALRRIDGDLAQLLSINSEIGNINFSPEYYEITTTNSPTRILGSPEDPAIAVWFSSTTQNLQTKDYLTPGRINFRSSDNTGYYPYPYGIKSQVVPFYQWKLSNGTTNIFGNQYNNWATEEGDIVQGKRYQSLDRTEIPDTTPSYFISSNLSANPNIDDLNKRGYIFSVDPVTGNYSPTGVVSNKFVVGAPFQFYFGIIKGESALDKFKTKYAISE
jgi:hypothetical protein